MSLSHACFLPLSLSRSFSGLPSLSHACAQVRSLFTRALSLYSMCVRLCVCVCVNVSPVRFLFAVSLYALDVDVGVGADGCVMCMYRELSHA